MSWLCSANLPDESKERHEANDVVREVNFPPFLAKTSRSWVRMVIVVPALPEGE
jgi:hypothetical protein